MKAIIFDCFGVLTTDLWREFVGKLPDHQRQAASDINKAYDAGFMSESEFVGQVEELTGSPPPLTEDQTSAVKNYELLQLISQLKTNYKIGMLSNIASDWITDSFLTPQEQELFDIMLFSHHVGLTKPNPQIFILAAEKLEVEPEDCLMIDDVERNCSGAESVGMKSIWYKNYEQTSTELNSLLSQSGK